MSTKKSAKPRPATTKSKSQRQAPAETQKAESKSDCLQRLLNRKEGATIAQMSAASGWQAHSVRGFISGTLKKKLGLPVTSSKEGAERVYRLEATQPGA